MEPSRSATTARIAILILLSFACFLEPGSSPMASDEKYPGDVAMLELARAGDVAALERARKLYLPDATPAQRFAIFLASRRASPTEFAEEFIDSMPDKPGEGWPDLSGYREAAWDDEFFVAGELADIAESGNRVGIRKLVQLTTWADGAWAEILGGGIVRSLISHPEAVMDALASRTPQERLRILNLAFWLSLLDEDVDPLLAAVRGARTRHLDLQREIENIVTRVVSSQRETP